MPPARAATRLDGKLVDRPIVDRAQRILDSHASRVLGMALQTLAGVTVLDCCSYLAGPYGAALLGDMGADVIKIESPGGDMLRHYPSTLEGESRAFVGTNRNKRSIVIDLKTPGGLAVLPQAGSAGRRGHPELPSRCGAAACNSTTRRCSA